MSKTARHPIRKGRNLNSQLHLIKLTAMPFYQGAWGGVVVKALRY
jgi:hypothetical protein